MIKSTNNEKNDNVAVEETNMEKTFLEIVEELEDGKFFEYENEVGSNELYEAMLKPNTHVSFKNGKILVEKTSIENMVEAMLAEAKNIRIANFVREKAQYEEVALAQLDAMRSFILKSIDQKSLSEEYYFRKGVSLTCLYWSDSELFRLKENRDFAFITTEVLQFVEKAGYFISSTGNEGRLNDECFLKKVIDERGEVCTRREKVRADTSNMIFQNLSRTNSYKQVLTFQKKLELRLYKIK